jgi:putative ABC transport system permease protein
VNARVGRLQWTVDRRTRAALLISGLRWRARSSFAMLAVAVFATGIAAFGPIYLHSADQVVLTGTLAPAAPVTTGLEFFPATGHPSLSWLEQFVRSAPEPSSKPRWWGTPLFTETAGFVSVPAHLFVHGHASVSSYLTSATSRGRRATSPRAHLTRVSRTPYRGTLPFAGTLVARTGECAHLHMVSGTCARGRGVIVSTRDAATLGVSVGGSLRLVFGAKGEIISLPIVGVYEPGNPAAPYWWAYNYFIYGSPSQLYTGVTNLDAVFATFRGLAAWVPKSRIYVLGQVPYHYGSLTVDSVGGFRQRLTAYEASAYRSSGVRVSTRLLDLLHQAGVTEHATGTVVDVVDLELALLGIFVLYFVANRTAAEREPDVRLAELRGFRMRSTIAVALAEPVAIVTAAVPLGLLIAWVVARAAAPAVFGAGVGVYVTRLAVIAALVAGLVGVAAAALGARRSLAGGLSAAADALPTPGSPRWALLGDVAWVALAGAGFFELVVSGDSGGGPSGSNPLAALSPGLLAIALGVLAARWLPRALGVAHRRTAFSPRVAAALSTRTVARRKEYRTQLVLVALAVALTTFAVSGWVISARNRDDRAKLGVGASKVLEVSIRTGTTFVRAVRNSDPTGRYAMAAVVEHAADGTTLAVDAQRLATVATWPSVLGVSAAQVARRLIPKGLAPQLLVRGTTISVTADMAGSLKGAPELAANVYDMDTQFSSRVTLGRLRPGAHRYEGGLYADCPGGCRLLDLSVTWSTKTTARTPTVVLGVTSLAIRTRSGVWTSLDAGLGDLHRWAGSPGRVQLTRNSAGLNMRFSLNSFGTVAISPTDVPKALPTVVTPTSQSTASGESGPLIVGLDGSTLPGHQIAEVPALPGVGTDSVLVDLPVAELYLTDGFTTDTAEVWLTKGAPRSIVSTLRQHGVRVVGVATAAGAVAKLSRSGLNLAYLLYLLAAVAAALLVVSATAFTLSSAARRRQGELSALRAVGVDTAALRRAVWAEQALVLGAGILVGVLAGAVAAAVAIRSVPEFVVKTPGLPLQLGLPVVDLTVAVVALLLALAVTVLIGSSVVVRGAGVVRLTGNRT